MPRVVRTSVVDAAGLVAAQEPQPPYEVRADEPGTFAADTGPFDQYRRTVEPHERADGAFDLTETIDFTLAIPVWAPLFNPLVKRQLRHPPPPDASAPW